MSKGQCQTEIRDKKIFFFMHRINRRRKNEKVRSLKKKPREKKGHDTSHNDSYPIGEQSSV
jgi:hypothetical protein